jgi:hypothetical protein
VPTAMQLLSWLKATCSRPGLWLPLQVRDMQLEVLGVRGRGWDGELLRCVVDQQQQQMIWW